MDSILLGSQFLHHTACWQPSWKEMTFWQQMDSQQLWQHSTYHLGSSTNQHMDSIHLGSQFLHIACWQPSWKEMSFWQQMDSQQLWQHSTYHLGSNTILHMDSILLGSQFLHHTACWQ